MSRKKKQLYAAILAMAAAMLLMDRALRGGSIQTASAATARSLEALGVETSAHSSASVAAAPFPGPLPEQVTAVGQRNIFVLSQRLRNRLLGLTAGGGKTHWASTQWIVADAWRRSKAGTAGAKAVM